MTADQPSLTGKPKLAGQLNSVTLREIEGPVQPLSDKDIVASARHHVPDIETFDLASLATLTAHTPAADGIAHLTFEVVQFYFTGDGTLGTAIIGSNLDDGVSKDETPKLSIRLVNSPAGSGNLLTCRVFAVSVGPNFPGFFHIEGPGVSASFTDTGSLTTFSFVVPAGVAAPATIAIHTDRDRIGAWAFIECAISQL